MLVWFALPENVAIHPFTTFVGSPVGGKGLCFDPYTGLESFPEIPMLAIPSQSWVTTTENIVLEDGDDALKDIDRFADVFVLEEHVA
jgi:hypothetical protein